MFDSLFEKGLLNFIMLLIVTTASCWILSRTLVKDIDRFRVKKGEESANMYVIKTIRFMIWMVGFSIVLGQIKAIKPLGDSLLGASGILAVGISIAAQTTFSNYISGFFLTLHEPFKIGDVVYLKEKNISGTVKEITFRHTCIETKQGTLITIPNTVMNTVMIEDLSYSGYTRPLEFKVGNEVDLDKLKKIIEEVLAKNELALNKEAKITVDSFDGDSYSISVPVSARTMKEFVELKNTIIPELNKAFRKHKIRII